jgi:hypothetical protein
MYFIPLIIAVSIFVIIVVAIIMYNFGNTNRGKILKNCSSLPNVKFKVVWIGKKNDIIIESLTGDNIQRYYVQRKIMEGDVFIVGTILQKKKTIQKKEFKEKKVKTAVYPSLSIQR